MTAVPKPVPTLHMPLLLRAESDGNTVKAVQQPQPQQKQQPQQSKQQQQCTSTQTRSSSNKNSKTARQQHAVLLSSIATLHPQFVSCLYEGGDAPDQCTNFEKRDSLRAANAAATSTDLLTLPASSLTAANSLHSQTPHTHNHLAHVLANYEQAHTAGRQQGTQQTPTPTTDPPTLRTHPSPTQQSSHTHQQPTTEHHLTPNAPHTTQLLTPHTLRPTKPTPFCPASHTHLPMPAGVPVTWDTDPATAQVV